MSLATMNFASMNFVIHPEPDACFSVNNVSIAVDSRRSRDTLSTVDRRVKNSDFERDRSSTFLRQLPDALFTTIFADIAARSRFLDSTYSVKADDHRQQPAEHYYYDCF